MGGGGEMAKISGGGKKSYANGTVPDDVDDYTNQNLVPCKVCGRNFNSDRVQKHQAACQKVAKRKPKVFDMKKQRLEGVAETGEDM